MKKLLISLISLYQKLAYIFKYILDRLGLVSGNNCVFFPSCSVYAKEAIQKHGSLKGSYLAIRRILRCHPWQKNHIDPVP